MKRVFFFGVVAYSVLIFLLNDFPAAINFTGTAAMPWMGKCLVDIAFTISAFFALFGDQIEWDEDEEGVHADDVKVPAVWLYGLFGLNLLANWGWHGYEFATLTNAGSFYNGIWWIAESIAMFLTFVLFRHARATAIREARRARNAASNGVGTGRPRHVA